MLVRVPTAGEVPLPLIGRTADIALYAVPPKT